MTVQDMSTAYHEVRNALAPLLRDLREDSTVKYSVSRTNIQNIFDAQPLWKHVPQSGGHRTYKHLLTGKVIGFQNHPAGKGGNDISPKQAVALLDALQEHVNILGNQIFRFQHRGWDTAPDFQASVRNYEEWRRNQQQRAESA